MADRTEIVAFSARLCSGGISIFAVTNVAWAFQHFSSPRCVHLELNDLLAAKRAHDV